MATTKVPKSEGPSHALSTAASVLLWFLLLSAAGILVWKGIVPALSSTQGDFANYYTASRLLSEGVSLETAYWDFVWFQQQMDRVGIRNQVGGWIPHPPPTALAFLPLTAFDAAAAKKIWIWVNLALAIVAVILLQRTSRLHWLPTAVLFSFTGYGLLNNFLFGQLYLLLLVTLLLSLYCVDRGWQVMAGICLGSLIPVKYFGVFFLLIFAWKRRWKLVVTSMVVVLMLIVSLLWIDPAACQTFVHQVLPRHLEGEIQDPFGVAFQSWNSLYRRLFLYEETLNPAPIWVSSLLFLGFRNLTFWILAGVALLVMTRIKFPRRRHQYLFEMGWIPLVVLLLSPGSATYHFLLLTISLVFLVKILVDLGKFLEAAGLGILYAALNAPHYMKTMALAAGWWTPLAYTRLWFLVVLFLVTLFLFRSFIRLGGREVLYCTLALGALAAVQTGFAYALLPAEPQEQARRLSVPGVEFARHLSLIVRSPDVGRETMLFGYCELLDNRYGVFSLQGRRRMSDGQRNYYYPDLAADDRSLLVETVENGRHQVWLSTNVGDPPRFLVDGGKPRWHPNGTKFVFQRQGRLYTRDLVTRQNTLLPIEETCYDADYSADGNRLVYCVREKEGSSLRTLDLGSLAETVLARWQGRVGSPRFSADGEHLVFALDLGNGHDIWALDLARSRSLQLTWSRAQDIDPIWDEAGSRIVFVSDRERGLGCTTLYWMPIPEEMN